MSKINKVSNVKTGIIDYLILGIMTFSMAFGAGDIISILKVGHKAGSSLILAIAGFVIMAAIIPFFGLIAGIYHQGKYQTLLETHFGKILSLFISTTAMLLLGPIGAIPRCVDFSYSTLSWSLISINKLLFNLIFLGLVYVLGVKKYNLIGALGKVVGPINIFLMLVLIGNGLIQNYNPSNLSLDMFSGFKLGSLGGFLTVELVAMLFFSGVIFENIKFYLNKKNINHKPADTIKVGIISGFVTASIFTTIYTGFGLIAHLHSGSINIQNSGELLVAYGDLILGKTFGNLSSIIVSLACFSTSLALSVVFADFLVQITNKKINYNKALLLSISTSFAASFWKIDEIESIMKILVLASYPLLIILVIKIVSEKIYFHFKQKRSL